MPVQPTIDMDGGKRPLIIERNASKHSSSPSSAKYKSLKKMKATFGLKASEWGWIVTNRNFGDKDLNASFVHASIVSLQASANVGAVDNAEILCIAARRPINIDFRQYNKRRGQTIWAATNTFLQFHAMLYKHRMTLPTIWRRPHGTRGTKHRRAWQQTFDRIKKGQQ